MYLLRVQLPDTPGSLGAVATALGQAGADIVAVDVVEHQVADPTDAASSGGGPVPAEGRAIDDILVELPLGGRADTLVSACQSVPGVQVTWLSPYAAGRDLRRDLEAVEAMTERPAEAAKVLVEHAPAVFRADWTLLLTMDDKRARVLHASAGAPDLPPGEVPWLPLESAARLEFPESWSDHGWRDITAAAAPLGRAGGNRAVVIGRAGGPEILDSELARLRHLAALCATISDGVPGNEDRGIDPTR